METKLNIDLKTLLLIGLLLVVGFGGGFTWLTKKFNNVTDQLEQQINITQALQADITYTKNALGEEIASKQTLQGKLDIISDQNLKLTDNQAELIHRMKSVQDDNDIISAALVRTEAKLDSAMFANTEVDVNEKDSTLTFKETNDSVSFDITVGKALAASKKFDPTIRFNSLLIPNKQFFEFHWDDDTKMESPPVSFSVTNSNPLMRTIDVDSYIIPQINKDALQPTGWQKTGQWFGERKNEIIVGGVCIGVGTLIGLLLAQ